MPEDNSLTGIRKTCIACRQEFLTNSSACPACGPNKLVEIKRDAFIGRTLADRYQVESIIGTGGMGVVYKAWQEGLKRSVAIKVLRHQFLNDEMSVKRFQQEAIAASRLAHPHIVALHDYGSTGDGYLFMVMDIIDGKSLAQEEREKKTIGVDRSIKIITQVCEALEHAHRNGIVHRDLKPGNIMLTNFHGEQDYVKLVDFGIAKLLVKEEDQELTQKGEVFGSPLYMSPEQCLGHNLDGRSDIYSLGTVLYEALTGFVPHLGRNAIETIDMQIHKEPMPFAAKRPDIYIPERLEAVVLKALAKDPTARQQTMKEFALELEAAVPRKNEALNLRAKIEPAKNSGSQKSLNKIVVIGGLVMALALATAAYKLSLKPLSSNTVPGPSTISSQSPPASSSNKAMTIPASSATDGATSKSSTSTGTSATTVSHPYDRAKTSGSEAAQKNSPVIPNAIPKPAPAIQEQHAHNQTLKPTANSAARKPVQPLHHHKPEKPKSKSAVAKGVKPSSDRWANLGKHMNSQPPKEKTLDRWSHMEQQLRPISP